MASDDRKYRAPEVEDYHSDESVAREKLPRKASPNAQANVSTKRSKDLNLNSDKAPPQEKMPANVDGRSDSGYSSYTAASKSSADSAPSTSRHPPTLQPVVTAPAVSQSPASKSRRSAGGESRQHSNESSPRQKPLRTASVSSKQRPAAGQRRTTLTQAAEECKLGDPNWITCGPNARRPEMPPPSMSARHARDNYPSDQLSQHSDPHPYSPPSPTYTRQPAPYSAGPTIVQTARTRRPSAAGTRPRPQSFAGDPSAFYGYPSPPQEPQPQPRGPPPAFYNNMQHMPNMSPLQYAPPIPPYGMHPVQQPGYPYPSHAAPQAYDARPQRPDLSARGSSGFGRSFPAPIITQDGANEPSQYSARYGRQQPPTPVEHHQPQKRLSHHPPPKLLQYGEPPRYEDEVSEEEFSEGEEEEDPVYDEYDAREEQRRARALMPPPKIARSQSQRRPPLSHSKTAPAVERLERRESRRKSIVVNDPLPTREPHREPRERARRTTVDELRRPSLSRPRPHRSTQSEYVTPQARIEVNNSRSNRLQSYQYEKEQMEYAAKQQARALEERYKEEQKRQRRASKVYVQQERRHVPGQFDDDEDEDEESEEEPPVPTALRNRRRTDADERRKGKERGLEPKNKRDESAAEEYIMSTRGSRDPYADSINQAAKRGSRLPYMPSDSGSSQSNGSGRASQSNRTTMTSNTNNEVRLRLESGQAINLQLSGDMEGRTLQLLPAENGMTDLVIGNARGGETIYNNSERGSMRGGNNSNRRSIMGGQPRRDVEDVSEWSSRSGRTRREHDEIREPRDEREHVLRRSRKTTYH